MNDRERAAAFLQMTYRRRVERVEAFPWGELLSTPSLDRVYDANFALVSRWDGSADELAREMDDVQERAGFAHRKTVILDDALAERMWDGIRRQRWEFASRYVLMVLRRPPDREADTSVRVVAADDGEWADGRRAMIAQGDGLDPHLAEQLVALDGRLSREIEVRHLAAVVDGAVVSYAGLYLDGGVGQIEDVATLPAFQNRGLARALVLHAAADARAAGSELVFLVADDDDWPKELYTRLGFDRVGTEYVFGRPGRQHSDA